MNNEFDMRTDEERYNHVVLTQSGKSEVEDDDRSTKDKLSTETERNETWKTDLGETMNWNKKLTLRDLGHYFGERFSAALSGKEGINNDVNDPRYFGGTILAKPSPTESNNKVIVRWNSEDESALNNLYASMVKRANGGLDYNDDSDADEFSKEMTNRMYGNQLELSNFADYAKAKGNGSGLRMGSSKVLNPDFQFNEVDDVRSDFRRPFIGRLYSERIYDYNLPVVYFQPGTVSINSATVNFLSARANNQFKTLQSYLKSEPNPVKWVGMKLANGVTALMSTGSKVLLDVGQWWKWTSQSLMYMRYVNEMLLELAEWMGLFQDINSKAKTEEQKQTNDAKQFMESFKNSNSNWLSKITGSEQTIIDENGNEIKLADDEFFAEGGPFVPGDYDERGGSADINEDGIQFHTGYIGREPDPNEKSSANVGIGQDPNDGLLSVVNILPMYADVFPNKTYKSGPSPRFPEEDESQNKLGWKDLTLTVPYAISNTVSISESFDNSSGQHPLVDRYNQQFEQANQSRLVGAAANAQLAAAEALDSGSLKSNSTVSDIKDFIKGIIKDGASKLTSSRGWSGEAGMVMSGAGRYVLPEIWTDSSFSRSYSINFKFRSPYGSKLSIFENTFVPLIFLMGMAIPRKVAIQSYTNPFYVKTYCKGLFSIELGMITSLSISRGEEKNDRTNEQLFRSVNVTVNVKDMLSCLPMGLDGGVFGISKSANNGMFNYMANLAGIDFVERTNLYHRANVAIQSTRNGYYDMLTKLKIGLNTKLKIFSKAGSFVGRTYDGTAGGGIVPHRSH